MFFREHHDTYFGCTDTRGSSCLGNLSTVMKMENGKRKFVKFILDLCPRRSYAILLSLGGFRLVVVTSQGHLDLNRHSLQPSGQTHVVFTFGIIHRLTGLFLIHRPNRLFWLKKPRLHIGCHRIFMLVAPTSLRFLDFVFRMPRQKFVAI